jgi:2-polyprenyl-3-methyl-5-hydroxy-6-metoxy-1,4-benzoquinol methylase
MRPSRQARITRHFGQRSSWWDWIYAQTSLEARILRRRQQVALGWVEQLSLSHPARLRILEIGCGAGATAVQLARRGHLVAALDRIPAMLQRTRNHAVTSGVGELVTPILGDAHQLMFPTGTFDLVLALGVLSWLEEPNAAIKELARVTRPDGHLLVSSLNSLDLARLLDPGRTPLLAPVRSAARLAAPGSVGPGVTWCGPPDTCAGRSGGNCAAAGCSPSARPPSGSDPSPSSAGPYCPAIRPSESTRPSSTEPTTTADSSAPVDGCTSSWPASPTQAKFDLRLVRSSRTNPHIGHPAWSPSSSAQFPRRCGGPRHLSRHEKASCASSYKYP